MSDKQISNYKLIKKLRGEGLTYKQIAILLNEQGITTTRGKTWLDGGVHSAEKKMEKRFARQQKEEIKIKDMTIRFEKKSK